MQVGSKQQRQRLVCHVSERLADDLAPVRTDRGWSLPTFASGGHWGDDRRSISSPAATVRNTRQAKR